MKKYLLILSILPLFYKVFSFDDKPNIIIVSADQMVPMLTGPCGNKKVHTPNLDKLASEGVVFLSVYSNNPLCAPGRASMLTGRYSTNIRVYDNAAPLASDIPTICYSLQRMNYETILSGKVHFVGPDQLHGFSQRLIPSHYPTDFSGVKSSDNKISKSHAKSYLGSDIHVSTDNSNYRFDEMAQERAIEFIQSEESKQKPFFLMVSCNFPHEPFYPPQKYWDMYKDVEPDIPTFPEGWKEKLSVMDQWLNRHHGTDKIDVIDKESLKKLYRTYYALITYVDDKLGELMENLRKERLDENTLVIFTSDHGEMLGHKGMVQKRGFYEWSARVPLILRFPDKMAAGRKVETTVSLIDIVPTIFDYSSVPEDLQFKSDGKSLLPLLENEDNSCFVISESHFEGVYTTCFMVRMDDFKYNYFHNYGEQLFNIKIDPEEWNNLAENEEFNEIKTNLKKLIFANFNPDEIEQDLRESINSRMLIQPVLKKNKIDWKYTPDDPR
ncbi:MAG TPA: sulfatase-like hydrolase/transferase [Draconibacterium sp.]|nr:sulfatase-like hydrolase/transferase [Draconibacterium sp.]